MQTDNELDAMKQVLADIRRRSEEWLNAVPAKPGFRSYGKVSQVLGTLIEATMPPVEIGELCHLMNPDSPQRMMAEVVGFTDKAAILSALSPLEGVSNRTVIEPLRCMHEVEVGEHMFGCVLDGFGHLQFRTPAAPDARSTWRDTV